MVPYNPYLCQKYDGHINVEVCATVKAVKYIYKYIFKGHDRAQVEVTGQVSSAAQIFSLHAVASLTSILADQYF